MGDENQAEKEVIIELTKKIFELMEIRKVEDFLRPTTASAACAAYCSIAYGEDGLETMQAVLNLKREGLTKAMN